MSPTTPGPTAFPFAQDSIWLILQGKPSELYSMLAVVCSSWSAVNVGTSKRCIANAAGDTSLLYVAEANSMCARLFESNSLYIFSTKPIHNHSCIKQSMLRDVLWDSIGKSHSKTMSVLRTVLLAVLIVAMGGTFFIEQPGGSYMEYYEKLRWLYKVVPVIWLGYKLYILMAASIYHA